MTKRIGIVFFLFVLGIGALCLRLMQVPTMIPAQSSHANARVTIGRSRGAILDRNGTPLVHAQPQWFAAAKPTTAADQFLCGALTAERYALLEPHLARGNLIAIPIDDATAHVATADVASNKDILIVRASPRYSGTQLAPHLIGHLTQESAGAIGLEKAFEELLSGAAGELSVRMAVDAQGRALAGAEPEEINANYCSPAGIQLTIDANMQRLAQEALANGGITQGAVVVLDAATSEILALASAPAFDPNDVAASLNDPLRPFFNRALGAYPIGSTFKCFVAAAALEQGISENFMFTCTGELDVNGRIFRCKEKTHGTVDMTQALVQSCNLYFIRLAQRLRQQPAMDLIRLFGFGAEIPLADGIASAKGNLPTVQELALPGEWANFSFGQGKLLGAPLQIAAATACITNGGVYRSSALVKSTLDEVGTAVPYEQTNDTRQVISPKTAAAVRQMMIATVEEGSGKKAAPKSGSAGGKTATAQSGKFNPDGSEILHTAFTGFYPAKEPRYVITVFRENGQSGAGDCAPVFRAIANGLAGEGEISLY